MNTTRFDVQAVQDSAESRQQRENRSRAGVYDEVCLICGTGIKSWRNPWWVHMSTDGTLFLPDETDIPPGSDQGWFPVGTTCAKRIPVEYLVKSS